MKNWYKDIRKKIIDLYGNDADLFCDILAATSPRKSVKANWNLANRIFNNYKSGKLDLSGCLPCHKSNVIRAIQGQELSGRKVQNFAKNLKGNLYCVTVDIWIMRYFNYTKITDKIYDIIELAIQTMAYARQLKPAEMQAILWYESIKSVGKTPKTFMPSIEFYQLKLF